MSDERDLDRLDLILEMIGHLRRRLDGATVLRLLTDRDELDLTAYRLAVIGEAANKLTATLKGRHPHIAWRAMYTMRNIVAHDYASVDPVQVWRTVATIWTRCASFVRTSSLAGPSPGSAAASP